MWSSILDIIFPPRPTELTVRSKVNSKSPLPRSRLLVGQVMTLAAYHNPVVHAAIVENKFYNSEHAASLLATLLQSELDTLPTPLVCIPIPLGAKRQKERGYNQVMNVLTRVRGAEVKIVKNALIRTKETAPQTSLTRTKRLKNIRGAFAVNTSALIDLNKASTVVIVDDVLTTGATLQAAQASLAPHLPPTATLVCIALAH